MAFSAFDAGLVSTKCLPKPGLARGLLRRVMGIDEDEVTFARRGFKPLSPTVGHHLECVGGAFLAGYHASLLATDSAALVERIDEIEPEQRGFAFEGAAMALYLMDRLTPWRRNRFENLVAGPGSAHVYMLYIGAGWALARLPRPVSPALDRMDPLLRWLALDGYAFHEAYFHPEVVVEAQRMPARLTGYQRRAFDQGLGRGLWFVEGADGRRITARIGRFDAARRSDLWSGVGLACGYAGGLDEADIVALRDSAVHYAAEIAQGAAFAAKARCRAGNVTANTETACRILCDMTVEEAAAVTDEALSEVKPVDQQPAYETWRRRIQARFREAGM